jgi:Protein of unknown function (DUF1549)/Protein of unknown function (DUF1553)
MQRLPMQQLLVTLLCLAACNFTALVQGAEKSPAAPTATVVSVDQRFKSSDVSEEPNFQKHVVPLFGRLGCNGRACHGSFQGQGGFQLSLFGYDFKLDHAGLMKKEDPRVVAGKPLESLMLTKPLSDEEHEGGKRFEAEGWEYQVFRKWIEAGAKFEPEQVEKLVKLEVSPAEIVFNTAGEAKQLRAIAVWENGTREDVTPLCRYVTGSDQVAKIDLNGKVTAAERGDTFLVVSYDKAVITVPVMRPVSDRIGKKYPGVATPTKIDELVLTKLRKMGIVPSDRCDDAEFLRRVSLDLCGTLPSADEVEIFLANNSPNKRSEKINELLETPAYAAWWATKFSDFTGNNDQQLVNAGGPRGAMSQSWYDWLKKRIADNVPYDEMAAGIVAGSSRREGQSYLDYCTQMSEFFHKDTKHSYAEWHSMPYFWARNNVRTSEDKAIAFAYSFMGVRVQCAQCHKHPFDVWSKDDFENFKGFFTRVSFNRGNVPRSDTQPEYEEILKKLGVDPKLKGNELDKAINNKLSDGAVIPFAEIYIAPPKKVVATKKEKDKKDEKKKEDVAITARLLGTDQTVEVNTERDPRQALMDWLRSNDNPYFAKALVNRVWANYFNVGIVEPPDDMSLGNPPSNGPLLDYLSRSFIEHKFDLKWLHREICNSDTYQRSWRTNDTNVLDERNFSRAVPRRLPAEVAYDALQRATASTERAENMLNDMKGRAIHVAAANANANGSGKEGFALKVFGRSIRESNCDCDRSMEASLLQTVYLQNDAEVLNALTPQKGTWMEEVAKVLTPPNLDRTKTRTAAQQVKVDLEKAKLRVKAAGSKDENQAKKLVARVQELETQLKKYEAEIKTAEELAAKPVAELPQLVREAYLRTLSRPPSAKEMERSLQFVASTKTQAIGFRDLLWALVNTKEFIVNH